MKINDLFKKDNTIYRILFIDSSDIQIIDCVKRTMPRMVGIDFFLSAEQVSEEELRETVGINLVGYDGLTQSQKQIIHSKYGSISMIVPFIHNDYERNRAIELCADKFNLSKATIKSRLCNYLAFQDICVFLPDKEKVKRPLTPDEKNFRWALNKYFYNGLKLPLKECYGQEVPTIGSLYDIAIFLTYTGKSLIVSQLCERYRLYAASHRGGIIFLFFGGS